MTTVQKFLLGLTAIGLVTALTLPDRKTPQVINAVSGLLQGSYRTVIRGR